MGWQDLVITICMIALNYALIPQIISGFKNKKQTLSKQTSLITAVGMITLCYVYFSLNLLFSSIMAFISFIFWTTLFLQNLFLS